MWVYKSRRAIASRQSAIAKIERSIVSIALRDDVMPNERSLEIPH
ncbi:hypothetical protein POG22_16555 [Geitlerinema sp. CS-897]|nr:hypothetical protein [Geitlerinema sp. CS-897]